jgi:CTP-dependent riboflavin kinase
MMEKGSFIDSYNGGAIYEILFSASFGPKMETFVDRMGSTKDEVYNFISYLSNCKLVKRVKGKSGDRVQITKKGITELKSYCVVTYNFVQSKVKRENARN